MGLAPLPVLIRQFLQQFLPQCAVALQGTADP